MTDYEKIGASAGFAFFSSLMATQAALSTLPTMDKLAISLWLALIYAGTALFSEWCKQADVPDKGGKLAAVCAIAGGSTLAAAVKPF